MHQPSSATGGSQAHVHSDSEYPTTDSETATSVDDAVSNTTEGQVAHLFDRGNPFLIFGAYPNVTKKYFNSYYGPYYSLGLYGLRQDNHYCSAVDRFNFDNPSNALYNMSFFTDFDGKEIVVRQIIHEIGYDTMPTITNTMPTKSSHTFSTDIDKTINLFFTKRAGFHTRHKIGAHFLCATQMYNHIPGHGVFIRKNLMVDALHKYALRYKNKPQCFEKNWFMPETFRLHIAEECKEFFKIINSEEYKKAQEQFPLQYLLKEGHGEHSSKGIYFFDKNKTEEVMTLYQNGSKCGTETWEILAQKYINNPLLFGKRKFDIKVYLLISSTNPLIAYYYDGYLKLSLKYYDAMSTERTVHFANLRPTEESFEKARTVGFNGLNEDELRSNLARPLEHLQRYLLSVGYIDDPDWLTNYLRPSIMTSLIHAVRMGQFALWKKSNVFEVFAMDFVMDEDLNLFFLEGNLSPSITPVNPWLEGHLAQMLRDLFDLQFSYYRSRMQRVLIVLKRMKKVLNKKGELDYNVWKRQYQKADENRIEPDYAPMPENGWMPVIDKNYPGRLAYFDMLDQECVDDYMPSVMTLIYPELNEVPL
jgi:hypothetical protein